MKVFFFFEAEREREREGERAGDGRRREREKRSLRAGKPSGSQTEGADAESVRVVEETNHCRARGGCGRGGEQRCGKRVRRGG